MSAFYSVVFGIVLITSTFYAVVFGSICLRMLNVVLRISPQTIRRSPLYFVNHFYPLLNKQARIDPMPYDELKYFVRSKQLPPGFPVERPEMLLESSAFYPAFGMSEADFWALPAWKKLALRKEAGLV